MLSGLLGTANGDRRSDKTGVSVGALGFPESGVMGAGIEIALSPADAFGFLQTEILDQFDLEVEPFFGYVSIRLCSKTQTLMGMQQFGDATNPCSVMIEVVGYGTDDSRDFIQQLQKRTVDRIRAGLDAMLHWGLENDQLRGYDLRCIKALQKRTRSGMSRLGTFKAARSRIHAAAPAAYRVFDNSFTERLGLSSLNGLAFGDDYKKVIHIWNPTALQAQPGSPLVENIGCSLEDLGLLNQSDRTVQVNDVRIITDAPGAPVFEVTSRLPFKIGFGQRVGLRVKYTGTKAGPLAGMVEVECDDPLDPIARIPLATSVIVNKHAELQLTPSSLDFGSTRVKTTVGQNVTLTNIGFYSANFDSIVVMLDEPARQFAIPYLLPYNLMAGQSDTIYVSYKPESRGASRATLVIEIRSRTDVGTVDYRRRYEIPLAGTAQMPTISLAARPQRRLHGLDGVDIPARDLELKVLDFGVAAPTKISVASFWVRNMGDAPLTVQGVVEYNQDTFGVNDRSIFPATLQPGSEMEVPCCFGAPPVPGPASGEFRVVSDDPLQPSDGALLKVKGKAAGPHLTDPGNLSIHLVPPLPASATITFRSDGTDPVTLSEVTLATGTGFSVSGAPQMPAQLAPGTELMLTLTLTATQPGFYYYQDQLRVAHDGNASGISQVVLSGYGTLVMQWAQRRTFDISSNSLVSESDHRVYLRRASRGHVAGQERHQR